jgi:hypothetical protein
VRNRSSPGSAPTRRRRCALTPGSERNGRGPKVRAEGRATRAEGFCAAGAADWFGKNRCRGDFSRLYTYTTHGTDRVRLTPGM